MYVTYAPDPSSTIHNMRLGTAQAAKGILLDLLAYLALSSFNIAIQSGRIVIYIVLKVSKVVGVDVSGVPGTGCIRLLAKRGFRGIFGKGLNFIPTASIEFIRR